MRIGVVSGALGSIDFLRALRAPSAASIVERNVLQMHQLWQPLRFAALAPVRSLAASFQRHRKAVTWTEAATDSRDGQTNGVAKTFRTYHAEISTRHTRGTVRL